MVFVIAAYDRGRLRDVKNGVVHILENSKTNEVGHFAFEEASAEVDAVASLIRNSAGGDWSLNVLNEPARNGRHFMDILEPTLGGIIRRTIPSAPKRMKVAFAMEKGAVVDLPDTASIKAVTAGLGWDVLGH